MDTPQLVRRVAAAPGVRTACGFLIESFALLAISQWPIEDQAGFYRATRRLPESDL